jgi:phage terminase small subunit
MRPGVAERISARVQEIVGRAAERAEVSLERVLRELKAIAFSDIGKAVTWGPSVQVREEEEDGQRVKVIVNAVLLVPSDKLDENTAAAIAAVSQGSNGAVRIKMHNKLAALVVLGKYLGMFDQRSQNSNVIYAISDEPMSAEEWKKQYVKPG